MIAGRMFGPYRVLDKLGEGGMGEVWRATDTKLQREVAIKFLPAEVAGDPERLARFAREARLLAALNHPNIAHVYGFERATFPDGSTAHLLAMELVPGEDLAERLTRGPIPVDEACDIATQIAQALEEAHEKGIVHRDLKPGNIKLAPDGKVKVLDFGLAKAYAGEAASGSPADPSQSPTLAQTGTQAGLILGTAAYMSPEQARGKLVDKRADIWAFGVVLFEMLAGKRLFTGETVSDTLAAVLRQDLDWTTLPAATPAGVRQALRRCLERDPKQRMRDIGDARLLIEDAEREPASPRPIEARPRRWREGLAWLLAVVGIGAAVALAWRPSAPPPAGPVSYFSVPLPQDQPLARVDVPTLALSPDGRTLAFTVSVRSGQTLIYVRSFDQPEARPLTGSQGGTSPFFSPDGGVLGFFADGELKTVPLAGGTVVRVADAPTHRGAAWAPDGSIVFSPDYAAGLYRVPATGGPAEPIVMPDTEKGERSYRWPEVLPDGRAVLFTVGSLDSPNDFDTARIVAYSFATGQRHTLVDGASMPRFFAPDTLVYSRAGVLFAVPFDAERLEVAGPPTPVFDGVAGDASSGVSHFALAPDGTLAVVRGGGFQSSGLLTLVDREGVPSVLPLSARGFLQPTFSPDGTRLAFSVDDSASGLSMAADVWVYTLASGTLSRLTFDGRSFPIWSSDSRRIAYQSVKDRAVLMKTADGSGAEQTLQPHTPDPLLPGSWSPDGRRVAVTSLGPTNEVLLVAPGEEPTLFETDASAPAFSPDGRWIAYASPPTGSTHVFVRPVSGPGKWQVSPEIGSYPRWSGDGRELFYIGTGVAQRPLMVVEVASGDSFRAGPPRMLIPDLTRYVTATAPVVNWDVAPSGDRFAFVELERAAGEGTRIDVALNWARHLAVARSGGSAPGR